MPLPMGEVAERKRGRRGSTLTIPIGYHSKNTVRPSQSRLRRASSPRGRAKGTFSICFTSAPTVPTMENAVPHLIHRLWRSPFPEGEGLAWFRSTAQIVFGMWHGGAPRSESKSIDCRGQSHLDSTDESSPLHCSVYWVVPFNHTGYIRDVAGGRFAAPTCSRKAFAFNQTGSIRNVPGQRVGGIF